MTTILVVEDNPANMKLAVLMLTHGGYEVMSAADAEAGLAMARASHPDLILMDIQLPGMDGLEATGHLKRDPATCAIPVVALTALAMKGDEERIRAAGCDGYIAKPMRYQEVLATIATLLPLAMTATPIELVPARILVVDDLADNLELLEIILGFDGFSTVSAGSGEEALELVASTDPVQLVLLDLMLPGIDGFEVTRRLKANPATRAIPVLILSALSDPNTRARVLEAGAEDLLTKPLNRTQLCARVRAALGGTWPNVPIVTK